MKSNGRPRRFTRSEGFFEMPTMQSRLYPAKVDEDQAIVAHLDAVSNGTTVEGWALYLHEPAVCHVQVRANGLVVAEDLADKYRLDLLEAGLGYGYCAFYAELTDLPSGTYTFQLFDGRIGTPIHGPESELTVHLEQQRRGPLDVRSLLRSEPRWTHENVMANLECLQLQQNLEWLGPERFVDRAFRFALGRWGDKAGLVHYAMGLREGLMTPEQVVATLINSDERRNKPELTLPSPLESSFPFVIDVPGGPYRRLPETWLPTPTSDPAHAEQRCSFSDSVDAHRGASG